VAGGFLDVGEGTPASSAAVMKAWRRVWGRPTWRSGLARDAAHDARCGVAVEALAVGVGEEWPIASFSDSEVDGAGVAESGGNQHGADLVAVRASGVRLVVETRPADRYCRRLRDQAFLLGVAVEAAILHSRQEIVARARPRRSSWATEAVDVSAPRTEQLSATISAPLDVVAQVQA
jgi:hypothetical protein